MLALKKILAICFALCILLQSFSKLWVVVSFKINQEYIAETLCVNKEMPAPVMCSGKCFLTDQLKKASEPESSDFPVAQFSKTEVVHFPVQRASLSLPVIAQVSPGCVFSANSHFHGQLFVHKVFDPPQV